MKPCLSWSGRQLLNLFSLADHNLARQILKRFGVVDGGQPIAAAAGDGEQKRGVVWRQDRRLKGCM